MTDIEPFVSVVFLLRNFRIQIWDRVGVIHTRRYRFMICDVVVLNVCDDSLFVCRRCVWRRVHQSSGFCLLAPTSQVQNRLIFSNRSTASHPSSCKAVRMWVCVCKPVVLKLFRRRPPCIGWIILWPPKRKLMTKTSSNLQFYLQILDCTKNKLIYKLTMLEQQFCL